MSDLPGMASDLVHAGLITEAQCLELATQSRSNGRSFVRTLIQSQAIAESELLLHLSNSYMLPALDLERIDPVRLPSGLIPFKLMLKHQIVPLRVVNKKTLVLGCTDPSDPQMLRAVQFVCQMTPDLVLVESSKIKSYFDTLRNAQGLEALNDEEDENDNNKSGKPLTFWEFDDNESASAQGNDDAAGGALDLDDLLKDFDKN